MPSASIDEPFALGGQSSSLLPADDAPFLAGGNLVETLSAHRGRNAAVLTRQGDGIHIVDVSIILLKLLSEIAWYTKLRSHASCRTKRLCPPSTFLLPLASPHLLYHALLQTVLPEKRLLGPREEKRSGLWSKNNEKTAAQTAKRLKRFGRYVRKTPNESLELRLTVSQSDRGVLALETPAALPSKVVVAFDDGTVALADETFTDLKSPTATLKE
jgi:hypothetical protein